MRRKDNFCSSPHVPTQYQGIWAKTDYKNIFRNSHPEVFLETGVLKICTIFTGEQLCRSAISIKLQSNFIKITLRHGCSPVNLLHIFGTPFPKNTSGWLPLAGCFCILHLAWCWPRLLQESGSFKTFMQSFL